MVVTVRDIEIAAGIDGHFGRIRQSQLRCSGLRPISVETIYAVAGHGGNRSTRCNFADAVVAPIDNVKVSGGVETEAAGSIKQGVRCGAAIARKPRRSAARTAERSAASKSRCRAIGGNFANDVPFGDVDIVIAVDGDTLRRR
jgi:hypothetical protein